MTSHEVSPEHFATAAAAAESVAEEYRLRSAEYHRRGDVAAGVERRLGVARLICFAVGTLAAIALAESRLAPLFGAVLIGAAGAVLFALVGWHSAVRERVRTSRALERGCVAGAARARRDWDAIPAATPFDLPRDHAFAGDLHVAGSHSVARILPAVSRVAGRRVLERWLLAEVPPDVDTISLRQSAVRELIARNEWRERLSVLGARLIAEPSAAEVFFTWAEGAPRTRSTRRLRWLGVVLAIVTVVAFIGAVAGPLPARAPMLLIGLNLLITVATRRSVDSALEAVAGHETRLRGVGEVLRHVLSEQLTAGASVPLAERLADGAVHAFQRFDQIAKLAEVRLSPMGHYALQAFVLWDLHVVDALERWRARYGPRARGWVAALGEIEALAALATLSHENPNWCFPMLEARDAALLEATDFGHPLLAPTVRVGNDVALGGAGDILFITGSNMSGKSTLLRAIGLNVVLAQAGAPVCARTMRIARTRLRTSVEATDALERGLSLFMAELLRIKAIVEAARAPADCPLLFIADEMLRGTNARDRHTAVIAILAQLVRAGASGVVATHDPDLAADERLRPHIRPFHLLERFRADGGATSMWFDYRLRPGLATTRNAIQLLELVGLGEGATGGEAATGRGARDANN